MLTEKDYCDYDTCVALKKLGFNDPTHFYYGGNGNYITIHGYWRPELIQRFSLYEAQKFLREEKNMEVNAFYDNMDAVWRFYIVEIDSPDLSGTHAYKDAFMSYEEALLEGIKEVVKHLKDGIGE